MKRVVSNADRWTRCAGFHVAVSEFEQRYPDHLEEAAREGIQAHRIASDLVLRMAHSGDPGLNPPEEFHDKPVDIQMRIKTRDYAHFCFSLMRRAQTYGGPNLWVEREVSCGFLGKDEYTVVDFALYNPSNNVLLVLDFKYGHREVVPDDNPQLILEAKALIDDLVSRGEDPLHCSIGIYQPNGPHSHIPCHQISMGVDEIETAALPFINAFHSAEDTCTAGSHCVRCEAKGLCKTLRSANFNIYETTKNFRGLPSDLHEERLEALVNELDTMKDMFAAYKTGIESLAVAYLKKGKSFLKWEYSHGSGHRNWLYEDKEITDMADSFGVDLREHSIVSPAQAEQRGLPRELVDTLCAAKKTAKKLRKKSLKKHRAMFGPKE